MQNEIRQIQFKCLEILKIVDSICRKYDIKYSLCGGSVVGAHLYGGCLSWDDDIDLMMTRENYEKFIAVALSELPQYYTMQNYAVGEEFYSTFTKIIDDRTTIVQRDGTISGIFLDITVYDKIPLKKKRRLFLSWKLLQVKLNGRRQVKRVKDIVENIIVAFSCKNRRKNLMRFQKKVQKMGRNCTQYSYAELFGAYCNTKLYSPKIFENYTEIDFEGERYMIVRDYVAYLENRYERTNFYVSEEEKVAPHYKYVNMEIPYREYRRSL